MKFGITPINLDIMDGFDLRNLRFPLLVEKAIDLGYEHIEISMDLEYILPGAVSRRIVKKLLKIKADTGITYSVHLPIWSIELASPNAKIRNASIDCIVRSIKLTEPLDPLAYVLHLTGSLSTEISKFSLGSLIKSSVLGLVNDLASISVEKILHATEISPELLAVENVAFPFDATSQVVDKYNLSICFDTGHLIVGYSGKDSVHEFLDKHLDRIIEFHLNDGKILADGRPNDHIAIGDGDFPMDIIGRIKNSGFSGPLVFELSYADAEKSLNRIRAQYPELF